jgi:hypothetical protein
MGEKTERKTDARPLPSSPPQAKLVPKIKVVRPQVILHAQERAVGWSSERGTILGFLIVFVKSAMHNLRGLYNSVARHK